MIATEARFDGLPLVLASRKELVAFGAVGAVPLLVLTDALQARLRGWSRFSCADLRILVLAAVWAMVILIGAAIPVLRRFCRRKWANVALLGGSIVVMAAAAEGVLRLTMPAPDVEWSHRVHPGFRRVFRPNPALMPGISGESRYTANSLGIRGTELPSRSAAYRILCVGGSTTACIYLDDSEVWTTLLMQQLNERQPAQPVWVGNVGKSGFSTRHHLKFCKDDALPAQMDCMVMLIGINDLSWALGGLSAEERAEIEPALESQALPLWHYSRIVDLARRAYRAVRPRPMHDIHVEDARGENYSRRRLQRQTAPLREKLPNLEEELRMYQRRIRSIVALCRSRDIRVVFVTQPVLWRSGLTTQVQALLWGGRLSDGQYGRVEPLRDAMDRFNGVLLATCAELAVECVDASSMSGREDCFLDDCHFTEAGAHELARLLVEWFIANPSRPPGGNS